MTHTITNAYLVEVNRGINLRQYVPRKIIRPHDHLAAEGIIMGALIGGNALIWTYVFVRWLVG